MSGQLDINLEAGATYRRVVTITDTNNVPINVSGDTFAGQVRTSHKSGTASANFTISFATTGTDGKIIIELSAAATSALTAGKNVYDIEWTKANGDVIRLLEGIAVVKPEVTR